MIKGWSKERGKVKDVRSPIPLGLLGKNCKQWAAICRDDYKVLLFRVASLLTFFSTLRISSGN